MRATVTWWDLDKTGQTIDSLRASLQDDGVESWARVPGLRIKFWVSDPQTNRWGAVMLWDSGADPAGPLPPNRAAELIGHPPTLRWAPDVEAIVEGRHVGRPADDMIVDTVAPEGLAADSPTAGLIGGAR